MQTNNNVLQEELWDYTFSSFLTDKELVYPTSLCCKNWRRLALKNIRCCVPPFSSPRALYREEGRDKKEGRGWLPDFLSSRGESLREFDGSHLLYLDDFFFERTLQKGLTHPERLTTLNLDLRSYRRSNIAEDVHDKALREALLQLNGLTSLSLGSLASITDDTFKDIPSLSNLTSLSLSWCNSLTNAGVEGLLSQCSRSLISLSLDFNGPGYSCGGLLLLQSQLSVECLKPIHRSPLLRHLKVFLPGPHKPFPSGYIHDHMPPNLTSLQWGSGEFCPEDLFNLPGNLRHLKLIGLQELPNDPVNPQEVASFLPSGLESLQHKYCLRVSDNYIRSLPCSLTNLDLEIDNRNTFNSDWMMHLRRLTRLDTLKVKHDKLSGELLARALPPQLHTLHFNTFQNIKESDLVSLPQGLKSCHISTSVTGLHPDALRNLPASVESMSVAGDPREFSFLQERTALKELRLLVQYGSPPLSEHMHVLPPNLDTLILKGCEHVSANLFRGLPRKLKKLHFERISSWDGDSPAKVIAELPPSITSLALCNLKDISDDSFLDAIPTQIRSLHLKGSYAPCYIRQGIDSFSLGKMEELGTRMFIYMP